MFAFIEKKLKTDTISPISGRDLSLGPLSELENEAYGILNKINSFEDFKVYITKCKLHHQYNDLLKKCLYKVVLMQKLPEAEFLLDCLKKSLGDQYIDQLNGRYYDLDFDCNTILTLACGYSSQEMVALLLKKGAFLRPTNKTGFTPYLYAFFLNKKEIIHYLESRPEFSKILSEKSEYGITAFIAAAKGGHVSLMEEILKKNKDAYMQSLVSGYSMTPFMAAIEGGSLDVVNLILKLDPNAYIRNKTVSPLMVASEMGFIAVMKFLINKNRNVLVEETYYESFTALTYAINGSKLKAIEYLLNEDPSLLVREPRGHTLISFATVKSNLEIVKYLLSRGAILDYQSQYFSYDLKDARAAGNTDAVKYLSEAESLLKSMAEGNLKKISEWIQKGNTLNLRAPGGNTLLHLAFQYGHEEIINYLLDQGFLINCVNYDKLNPVQFAVFKRQWSAKGANPFTIIKNRMQRIATSILDEKLRQEKLNELQTAFDAALRTADEFISQHSFDIDVMRKLKRELNIDHEILALTMDKKYWCHLAQEITSLKKPASATGDYFAQKEKLSHLIYSRHVICKENEDDQLEFVPPEKQTLDTTETEAERRLRLKYALKFAFEAEDFATAMRIAVEMTEENPTLPYVSKAALDAVHLKSKDEFLIQFALLHYKDRSSVSSQPQRKIS